LANKALGIIAGIGLLSLIPIWRTANKPREALNFWQFVKYNNVSDEGLPHIPYENAAILAETFYQVNRMNRL
jgi:hypothetical protein